jgi:hypothetical protein
MDIVEINQVNHGRHKVQIKLAWARVSVEALVLAWQQIPPDATTLCAFAEMYVLCMNFEAVTLVMWANFEIKINPCTSYSCIVLPRLQILPFS